MGFEIADENRRRLFHKVVAFVYLHPNSSLHYKKDLMRVVVGMRENCAVAVRKNNVLYSSDAGQEIHPRNNFYIFISPSISI